MLRLLGIVFFVVANIQCGYATYSIIACDKITRQCGVAVQTNNLAVGASVPYARAGVGGIVSQFETNPLYGPRGLELLAQGIDPKQALARLLAEDGNFDGQGIEARQVALVTLDGRTAAYTGQAVQSALWAGVRSGKGYSIQGNGLAGPQVLEEMERTFLNTLGTLAERLLAALHAGDVAGGQTTGKQSAALLVRTPAGFPMDIDLRVDSSHDPVSDLQSLFKMQSARQQVIQARLIAGKGDLNGAKNLIMAAVAQAQTWPRIWLQAARAAADIQEADLALQYLTVAFAKNRAWADTEIGNGTYSILGPHPLFASWVTYQHKENALAEYRKMGALSDIPIETGIRAALSLLEINQAAQALSLLKRLGSSARTYSLIATAYAAEGKYDQAIEYSRRAIKADPNNIKLHAQMARLQSEKLLKSRTGEQ